MTGTPGGGKSTVVNIIEGIVSLFNVTELRLEHMGSRFELQRLIGKTLLTAKDVRSNFLNIPGASKLKALVGNDLLTT
jgi:phage/plasmid-associated DNA primase